MHTLMESYTSEKASRTIINVAFICDDGYVMPTSVAITSLKYNKVNDSIVHVYIIASNLSEESEKLFLNFSDEYCCIHIIRVTDVDKYTELIKDGFPVTTTALYKFDLPYLLPNLDKVLYLDGDIIIQKDLDMLFNSDILGLYAGVVKDYRGLTLKGNMHQRLHIDHTAYFNSGVMLLNLSKMREDRIPEKLLEYRKNGINYYMDQDALNVVFEEKVRYLSFYNNLQMTCWRFGSMMELSQYYGLPPVNDRYTWIDQATIIHYTAEKPWVYFDGKCSERWLYYYVRAPFQNKNLHRISILTKCKNDADKQRLYQNRLYTNQISPTLNKEDPLISVIMPVYNAADYVIKAIRSLQNQTFVDFELICINDASTDATVDVLNMVAELDSRIVICNQIKNQGAGVARNLGLQVARGKYVTFLDADDKLPSNALETYYLAACETGAEYIIAQTFEKDRVLSSSFRKELLLVDGTTFCPADTADTLMALTQGGPSGKFIKKSLIEKHNIGFLPLARSEDFYFIHGLLAQASLVTVLEEPLYEVVSTANEQSLEHTKDKTPAIFWEATKQLRSYLIKSNLYEKYKKGFINSCLARTVYNIKMLKTCEGILTLHHVLKDECAEVLEIYQHDDDYYFDPANRAYIMHFVENNADELLWEYNDFLSKENTKLKHRLTKAYCSELEKKVSTLSHEKAEFYQLIQKLQKEKGERWIELQALRKEKGERWTELQALRKERTENRKAILTFTKEISEQQKSIQALTVEKNAQTATIQALQAKYRQQQQAAENLQNKLEKALMDNALILSSRTYKVAKALGDIFRLFTRKK